MEQDSDSDAWDSELDDIPLVMDDETCSEASGAYSSRSFASSEPGGNISSRSSARGSVSSRQRSLSRDNSRGASESDVAQPITSETQSRPQGRTGQLHQQGGRLSLPLSELSGASSSGCFSSPKPPLSPAVPATAVARSLNQEDASESPSASKLRLGAPMGAQSKLQCNLPLGNSSSSSSNYEQSSTPAPSAVRIGVPSLNLGSFQNPAKESAAGRGKPPPLALFNNNSASPAASPHVVPGRTGSSSSNNSSGSVPTLNLSSSQGNWAGVAAFGNTATATCSQEQQLVQVQLLLPAIDVYLPLQPADQAAAAASSSGFSRLSGGGTSSQFKRSGSKLARSSSSGEQTPQQQQPAPAAADGTDQQQCISGQAAAEMLQSALSRSIGIDPKYLNYFSLQPAELHALLQQPQHQQHQPGAQQQQLQQKSRPQHHGKSQHHQQQHQQAGSSAVVATSSAASPGVHQVVVGVQGSTFSLAALEGVLKAAEQQTAAAEAAKTELQQLKDELVLEKLRSAEYAADLGRLAAKHAQMQQEVEQTRAALEAERVKSAALQTELSDAGSTILKIKAEYEAVKAARGSRGARSQQHRTPTAAAAADGRRGSNSGSSVGGSSSAGSPMKGNQSATSPRSCLAEAAAVADDKQRQQREQDSVTRITALLQNPHHAAVLEKICHPNVMNKMYCMLSIVEHMPTFWGLGSQQVDAALMPPPPPITTPTSTPTAAAAAAAQAADMGGLGSAWSSWASSTGVQLSARGGCSTPRDPARLAAAAAQAAQAAIGNSGSGSSTARAPRSSSSSRGTPRGSASTAGCTGAATVQPVQLQASGGSGVVPPLGGALFGLGAGVYTAAGGCSSSRGCRGSAAAEGASESSRGGSESNTPRHQESQAC